MKSIEFTLNIRAVVSDETAEKIKQSPTEYSLSFPPKDIRLREGIQTLIPADFQAYYTEKISIS